MLRNHVLVGGGSGRAGGLLHSNGVGVPSVLLGLGLSGGRLKKLKLNMVTIWDLGDGKIERGGSSESWWSGIDKGEERSESPGDGGMRD